MQTIEVTDEQHAVIQQLRESIGEHVVGKYGYVRERDAVQFLLDNLDEDLELELEVDGTVREAIEEGAGPTDLEEVSYVEDDSVADDETDATADDEPTSAADEEDDDGADDEGDAGAGGSADDDDMLDEMMSLLETHDDKWEESSSADYRYTVTLPDGSTEDVQTKDDVRALLFKNYR
jgi:hypothetical protein